MLRALAVLLVASCLVLGLALVFCAAEYQIAMNANVGVTDAAPLRALGRALHQPTGMARYASALAAAKASFHVANGAFAVALACLWFCLRETGALKTAGCVTVLGCIVFFALLVAGLSFFTKAVLMSCINSDPEHRSLCSDESRRAVDEVLMLGSFARHVLVTCGVATLAFFSLTLQLARRRGQPRTSPSA